MDEAAEKELFETMPMHKAVVALAWRRRKGYTVSIAAWHRCCCVCGSCNAGQDRRICKMGKIQPSD